MPQSKSKRSRYTPPTPTTSKPSRYTPPTPKETKTSPQWVPVLMFVLFGLGVLTIILNYLGVLFGDAANWKMFIGLIFVTGGFMTATQYH